MERGVLSIHQTGVKKLMNDSAQALYSNGQKIDPQTLRAFRALQDPSTGNNICKKIIQDNVSRTGKDAAIMRKFNDEQPWNQDQLNAAGQGWRNNRSTGFMSSLVRRAIHPYKQTVDLAKYLTNSALPDSYEKWAEKSEEFQLEFTRVVRSWKGWGNFTYLLILENILFGHAQIVWTDTVDWTPTQVRSDDCLFPDGCPQDAKDVPLIVLRQNFQIHKLARYLKEPDVSASAGWNIDNLVKAINNSQPENKQKGTPDNARKVEDAARETTLGRTYSDGVNVVETNHLFIQEIGGSISHYLYENKTGDLLFHYEDQFESMDQVLALFTIEVGNGTVYGTKGAGRILYNTHVAVEQSRNLIADALYLSGLLIIKSTTPNKKKIALTVNHPFCVLGDGYEVVEHNFQANPDAFFSLDRHMTQISELQVGIFMPGMQLDKNSGDIKASQINYMAAVEQQIKEGVLNRFKHQFLLCMGECQRRMFSEENIKRGIQIFNLRKQTGLKTVATKVIKFIKSINAFLGKGDFKAPDVPDKKKDDPSELAGEAVANLMEKGLEPAEIFILANTCPDKITDDPISSNPQNLDLVVSKYSMDPNVDKEQLKKLDISQKIGEKLADTLIIPGFDQTVTQEQVRQQIMENALLVAGETVPVSPRDVHKIHMGVIIEKSKPILETMNIKSVTKFSLDAISKIVEHMDAHLQGSIQAGEKPESLKLEIEFVDTAKKLVESLQGQLPSTPQGGGAALPSGTSPAVVTEEELKANTANVTRSGLPVESLGTAAVAATNKPLSRAVVDLSAEPL